MPEGGVTHSEKSTIKHDLTDSWNWLVLTGTREFALSPWEHDQLCPLELPYPDSRVNLFLLRHSEAPKHIQLLKANDVNMGGSWTLLQLRQKCC